MKSNNLKTLMENFTQEPSGHCWQALEQQLSVVMPATAGAKSVLASSKGEVFAKMAAAPLKTISIISGIKFITQ